MIIQDRLAGGRVGGQDERHPVEAARAEEGHVDIPGVVGGAHHEDALIGDEAVELREQLVDDIAAGAAPKLAALLAHRVQLVEEDDAGCVPARRLEDLVQAALTLAEPEVQHVLQSDRQEAGTQLSRHRPGQKGLPTPRRSVEEKASPQ